MAHVEALRITGGRPLVGEVRLTGAKNSVLKLMAAALLARGRTVLWEVPEILDVEIMAELLRRLGCGVEHDIRAGAVSIDVPEVIEHRADYDLVRRMRASISVLGPLLSRCGEADIALPGGDNIGSRGLDMHVAWAWSAWVRQVRHRARIPCTPSRSSICTGATIWLDFPSVGSDGDPSDGGGDGVWGAPSSITPHANLKSSISARCAHQQWVHRSNGIGTSTLDHRGRRRSITGCAHHGA
jgi:UDP-N-acetylglucosamine 1-carboxyvinyltransferase